MTWQDWNASLAFTRAHEGLHYTFPIPFPAMQAMLCHNLRPVSNQSITTFLLSVLEMLKEIAKLWCKILWGSEKVSIAIGVYQFLYTFVVVWQHWKAASKHVHNLHA